MAAGKLSAEEIRLRGLLLAKNKELLQLHRDLVMTGMVSEDDFWATRRSLLGSQEILLRQRRPPSTSSLLGLDIAPQADIQGDLKYVLTPALIQSIFQQNPIVKRAYEEKVPSVVDEKTFWTQYFKSKFFTEGLSSSSTATADRLSPTGNILDEYYQESQKEQEGELVLRVTETLPISIDIMATTEDHFQSADPDVHPGADEKVDRPRIAAIRKLNKISSTVVQNSGIVRIRDVEDGMAELCFETAELNEASLNLSEMDVSERRDVIVDEGHLEKLKKGWTTAVQEPPFGFLSFADYSALMQNRRPISETSESTFNQSNLTIITPSALSSFTQNILELLRQFWSSFPPGKNQEHLRKISRMSEILAQMLQKLDGWISASNSAEEKRFLSGSVKFLREAAEMAIAKAQPSIPEALESSLKRAKLN